MSVIPFQRKTAKQQLLDIIEDFDFETGAAILYLDEKFDDMEGEFQIVSTYKTFGAKETFATENVATFVRNNAYPVQGEE